MSRAVSRNVGVILGLCVAACGADSAGLAPAGADDEVPPRDNPPIRARCGTDAILGAGPLDG